MDRYFIVLTVMTMMTMFGCTDLPTGPASLQQQAGVVSQTGPAPSPSAGLSHCQAVIIDARRVLSVKGNEVTIRVLAHSEFGIPYVRLWLGHINEGKVIGDFSLGDITITLPPGEHTVGVAVEIDNDGDGLADLQCDGSVSVSVKIPKPPEPPRCERNEVWAKIVGRCCPIVKGQPDWWGCSA